MNDDINQFFEGLFRAGGTHEKVASEGTSDVSKMSDADLVRLTAQLSGARVDEVEKIAAAAAAPSPNEHLDSIAMETLAGQTMANAFLHEAGLIKVALKGGLCRVCKSNPRVSTATTCAACGGA